MKTLMLKPDIYNYDTAKEFAEDFALVREIWLLQTNIFTIRISEI